MTYEEKRYGTKVEALPENAAYSHEASGYIRCGEVYCKKKKDGTYYHVHQAGGSNRGSYGYHWVYVVR